MSDFDRLLVAQGADTAVAAQDFDFLRTLDVSHRIHGPGDVAEVGCRIALAQLDEFIAVAGQLLPVGIVVLSGVVAPGFKARSVRLVGKTETQPEIMLFASSKQKAQVVVETRQRMHDWVAEVFLLVLRHGEQIRTVNLHLARTLLRLKDHRPL